jgi:hypothetical protein
MRFGKLDINPRLSPGVLDTATWDRAGAWAAVTAENAIDWQAWVAASRHGVPLPASEGLTPHLSSSAWHGDTLICLTSLPDGQEVFIAVGPAAADLPLGIPLGQQAQAPAALAAPAAVLAVYPTDAPVIDRFLRTLAPEQGPRALGPVPRLGIGTRMTTAVWPGIWRAMHARGFAANAIQNSVRELNFLDTLLAGRPAEKNIAFGFGTIETGYTGSSFEGLWVAGVLDGLKHGSRLPYGADADHIQVKRGADGMARALRMLDATRYYSFYTLDVSDVLDYAALEEARQPDLSTHRDLLAYHREPRQAGGFDYRPDAGTLGRLVGKYAVALDAVETLYAQITARKAEHEGGRRDGAPFDLELSIDEHPNEIDSFDCLTSETELIFVLLEAQRRGIPLTHVAPNFGVEKGTDYRGDDGLPGFEARVRRLCCIAEEFGVMADVHSGDDLSAASRQAIGRATGGRNHFKVSPNLQLLFAEVLAGYHPGLFARWWQDAFDYASREAGNGSPFARDCIRRSDAAKPSAHDAVFHNFSFAFVGRRDTEGQFVCREEFYSLSTEFYAAYEECIQNYLLTLANDVFGEPLATR